MISDSTLTGAEDSTWACELAGSDYEDMAWTAPAYNKAQINAAGKDLAGADVLKYVAALDVVDNWRTAHNFPLNTFQHGLRKRAKLINNTCLVAQRIKRLSSIEAKLRRFTTMRLHDMQDLGGCRAVMTSVPEVGKLLTSLKASEMKHVLVRETDYIDKPQKSGYRGIHLIYRYFSDRKDTYNDLKIEMQIRTNMQHAWATAVETVGTFTNQALKSSQGQADWLRFFALMGSAIATMERRNLVENTPSGAADLKNEIKDYATRLDVEGHLHTFGHALKTIETSETGDHYFLLLLDPTANEILIKGYKRKELEEASKEYLRIEQEVKGTAKDAVLVSVDSVNTLSRAYPNYFLDTNVFIGLVQRALK